MTSTQLDPLLERIRSEMGLNLRALKLPNRFPDSARSVYTFFNGGEPVMTLTCVLRKRPRPTYSIIARVPDTWAHHTHMSTDSSFADLLSPDMCEALMARWK